MRKTLTIITVIILGLFLGLSLPLFAESVNLSSWENTLNEPSIPINTSGGDPVTVIQGAGFKVLGFLKLFISGIALVYLVLIGVYMVIYSENEEKIKTQRKQIIYALIGFLFLNVPGLLYTVFLPSEKGEDLPTGDIWANPITASPFWNIEGFGTTLGGFIGFFKLFIFGVAVVMLTWGLFRMIVSAGDEEAQKQGKNRIIYGLLGLIFLAFVEGWSVLVANGDFGGKITEVGGKLFGIAIFFAAPIAIFFLIWGAYYYITSGGDEERTKKGKAILINTFIATLILIAGLSFMKDLVSFNL